PSCLLGRVFANEVETQRTEAQSERNQWRLGAEHQPQAERRDGGQEHPWQVNWTCGLAGLEPVGRYVTAASRQPHYGERRDKPSEREPGKRPPDRRGLVSQMAGKMLVDAHLDQMHEFEKAPRGGGNH